MGVDTVTRGGRPSARCSQRLGANCLSLCRLPRRRTSRPGARASWVATARRIVHIRLTSLKLRLQVTNRLAANREDKALAHYGSPGGTTIRHGNRPSFVLSQHPLVAA